MITIFRFSIKCVIDPSLHSIHKLIASCHTDFISCRVRSIMKRDIKFGIGSETAPIGCKTLPNVLQSQYQLTTTKDHSGS